MVIEVVYDVGFGLVSCVYEYSDCLFGMMLVSYCVGGVGVSICYIIIVMLLG